MVTDFYDPIITGCWQALPRAQDFLPYDRWLMGQCAVVVERHLFRRLDWGFPRAFFFVKEITIETTDTGNIEHEYCVYTYY